MPSHVLNTSVLENSCLSPDKKAFFYIEEKVMKQPVLFSRSTIMILNNMVRKYTVLSPDNLQNKGVILSSVTEMID